MEEGEGPNERAGGVRRDSRGGGKILGGLVSGERRREETGQLLLSFFILSSTAPFGPEEDRRSLTLEQKRLKTLSASERTMSP